MKKTSTLPPSLLNEIHTLNKAIIVTGAGISVNSGIPDFRSSNGLYKLKGKDMFDFSVLKNIDSASCFYSFMADLKSNILQATPSKTHLFIKFLLDSDKLLRCYTQNIDSLEVLLGLDCDLNNVDADVIQLHGDMDKVVCNICKSVFEFSEEYRVVYKNVGEKSASI